jgi:hypothetical protein
MWYKLSQKIFDPDNFFKIDNFKDRNLINEQIRSLNNIAETIKYCSKLVYQTQRGARSVANKIRNNKKISSFPTIVDLLEQADKIAMDSPAKFAALCESAANEIYIRVKKLTKLRQDFSDGSPDILNPKKGLF